MSGEDSAVKEPKILNKANDPYMEKILSLSSQIEGNDAASVAAIKGMTAEVDNLGNLKKNVLGEVEDANKKLMKFAETGELPKGRRDKLVNSVLMTFGASLLGNPTMAKAVGKALIASQKIMEGEEDNYAKALDGNLKSVQAMANSKIDIAKAQADTKIKTLAFARRDKRASQANRMSALGALQKASDAEATAKHRLMISQNNAERNRIMANQALKKSDAELKQLNREAVYQAKYNSYVSESAMAKTDAEKLRIFNDYKKYFVIDPDTKTLIIDQPKPGAFNKDLKAAGLISTTGTGLSTGNIINLRGRRISSVDKSLGDFGTKDFPPYARAGKRIQQALDAMSKMPKYKDVDLKKSIKTLIQTNSSIRTDLERVLGEQHDQRMGISSGLSQSSSAVKANSSGSANQEKGKISGYTWDGTKYVADLK